MNTSAIETQTNEPEETPQLKRKDKITGTVRKISLAGAVLNLGLDKPGFIHITQLQPGPVNRVEDAVAMGQEVTAWVRRVSPKKGYVDLTMIEPLALEWREIKKGLAISGKVTRIEKFGVFVEIGAERPGLIHISELSHDFIKNPHEVVSLDDEVDVQVLDVNRRKKQIKLSRKATLEKVVRQKEENFSQIEIEEEVDNTPAPTAMEMAWRNAVQKQKKDKAKKGKAKTRVDDVREDILSRTLENQVRTQ